jgi:hypothetical protein
MATSQEDDGRADPPVPTMTAHPDAAAEHTPGG